MTRKPRWWEFRQPKHRALSKHSKEKKIKDALKRIIEKHAGRRPPT